MKQFFIIIIFITISALNADSFKLSMSNDLYGMNAFDPIDDSRTVAFYSRVPFINDISIIMDYSVLTDRNLDTRIDEAIAYLSLPFTLDNGLTFTPGLGTIVTGNLGGGEIQNSLHRILGIYTVDSIYDQEELDLNLFSTLYIDYNIELISNKNDTLSINLRPYNRAVFIPNYLLNDEIGINAEIRGFNFIGTLGFRYMEGLILNNFSTLDTVSSIEDQSLLYLKLEAGNFEYDLELYLNGNFASGAFSINMGNIPYKKLSFNEIDLKINSGGQIDIDAPSFQNSISFFVSPFNNFFSRIDFMVKSVYGWNSPRFSPDSDIKELYFRGTHFTKLIGGININLLNNKKQSIISPFIGGGLGIENYHYFQEYDTDEQHYIPIYEARAGLQILLPQVFVKDNAKYGFTITGVYRDSLNDLDFLNKIFVNVGLTIALDL